MSTRSDVVLVAEGVSKSYGGTQALDGVSVEISAGTIHALVGGNGSGKSTFVKVLAGVVRPDRGKLAIGGDWVDAHSHTAARAKASGLHFVHQQNSTFPELTVTENLAMGRGFERTAMRSIAWRAQRARAREVLRRFEVDVDPDTPLVSLSPAGQMMVAIARALQDQDEFTARGLLVLDEPTASLPKHEVDVLLSALRRYAAQGQTIVYVSHRLEEITAIADEVTVLRNGRVAARMAGGEIIHDSLVTGITGVAPVKSTASSMVATRDRRVTDVHSDEPVLSLRRRATPHADACDELTVRAGEIVGVAGLLGAGRSRLLKQMFGVLPREDFEVVLEGQPMPPLDVLEAVKRGVAFAPENRLREAALPELSIAENLSITCLKEHSVAGWIKPSRERGAAKKLIAEFGVRAPSATTPVAALSGGNQQKVMLARWLQRRPKLLLLDEPTQGVDIGARNEIHDVVRAAAADGAAVLVVSSDFVELAALAHRAVVVSHGQVVGNISGPLDEHVLNIAVYEKERSL